MMLRRTILAAGIALLLPVGGLWAPAQPGAFAAAAGEAMVLTTDPAPLVVETEAGPRSFSIEIADDGSERERGLMFRTEMPDDHGMLFIFQETGQVAFWMKNTILPLDMVFIGEDGRINALRHGEPQSLAIIGPEEPVRFVLELNAGIAQKAGLAVGDRIRHPAIDAVAGSN